MLDFRLYQPADCQGCLDLLRSGHDQQFSEQRFRWLHEEGPGGPSAIALATAGSQIAGIYSVVRKPMQLADATYVGGRDVDPVVHPDHRGQGLFTRLLDFGLKNFTGIDFFYNFANPASAPGFYRQGWRDLSRCDDKIRQLGYTGIISREFAFWMMGRLIPAPAGKAAADEISAAELRSLLAAGPSPRPLAADCLQVVRDPAYLKWRYLDNPLHSYRYFKLGGPEAWALAVVRPNDEGNRLYVVDLADFGLRPKLAGFASAWTAIFPAAQVIVWSTVPAGLRSGWVGNPTRRGQGLPLLIREGAAGRQPASFSDANRWALTHGDLEIS